MTGNNNLAGKIAIVTGAGGSIGAAASLLMASRGAKIAAVDRPGSNFDDLIRQIGPDNFIGIEADVTDERNVERYVAQTVAAFGGCIDIFFNNAGIVGPVEPLIGYSLEDFRTVMSVNVEGVFLGLKYVLPRMVAQRSGSVINTSSIAGLRAIPNVAGYTTSKHAVIGLTRTAAVEMGPHGVRVNCVNPGPILGSMIKSVDAARSADHARRTEIIPARRYGSPEEVAMVVAFLASDDSAYVNGAVHPIDGGLDALRAT